MSRATAIALSFIPATIWVGFWMLVKVLHQITNVIMSASKLGGLESNFWFMKFWVLLLGLIPVIIVFVLTLFEGDEI